MGLWGAKWAKISRRAESCEDPKISSKLGYIFKIRIFLSLQQKFMTFLVSLPEYLHNFFEEIFLSRKRISLQFLGEIFLSLKISCIFKKMSLCHLCEILLFPQKFAHILNNILITS